MNKHNTTLTYAFSYIFDSLPLYFPSLMLT